MSESLKVCHFGISNPKYSRNRVILKGLRQNGVEVVECNAHSGHFYRHSLSKLTYVKRYIQLVERHAKMHYDVLVTSHGGQLVMPLAKFITSKPVVLDAFLGMHEMFTDLKPEDSDSYRAKAWYYLDMYSFRSADLILTDTEKHINYFHEQSGISSKKFQRVFVGSDDAVFFPRSMDRVDDNFLVMFWGTFIPL